MKLTKQMSYKTQFEKMDRHTGGKWLITALITTISAISCKARDFHVDYEFDLKKQLMNGITQPRQQCKLG